MIRKVDAEYIPEGKTKLCRDCNMFDRPHWCTLVIGVINPGGYCKYWEAKNKLPVK